MFPSPDLDYKVKHPGNPKSSLYSHPKSAELSNVPTPAEVVAQPLSRSQNHSTLHTLASLSACSGSMEAIENMDALTLTLSLEQTSPLASKNRKRRTSFPKYSTNLTPSYSSPLCINNKHSDGALPTPPASPKTLSPSLVIRNRFPSKRSPNHAPSTSKKQDPPQGSFPPLPNTSLRKEITRAKRRRTISWFTSKISTRRSLVASRPEDGTEFMRSSDATNDSPTTKVVKRLGSSYTKMSSGASMSGSAAHMEDDRRAAFMVRSRIPKQSITSQLLGPAWPTPWHALTSLPSYYPLTSSTPSHLCPTRWLDYITLYRMGAIDLSDPPEPPLDDPVAIGAGLSLKIGGPSKEDGVHVFKKANHSTTSFFPDHFLKQLLDYVDQTCTPVQIPSPHKCMYASKKGASLNQGMPSRSNSSIQSSGKKHSGDGERSSSVDDEGEEEQEDKGKATDVWQVQTSGDDDPVQSSHPCSGSEGRWVVKGGLRAPLPLFEPRRQQAVNIYRPRRFLSLCASPNEPAKSDFDHCQRSGSFDIFRPFSRARSCVSSSRGCKEAAAVSLSSSFFCRSIGNEIGEEEDEEGEATRKFRALAFSVAERAMSQFAFEDETGQVGDTNATVSIIEEEDVLVIARSSSGSILRMSDRPTVFPRNQSLESHVILNRGEPLVLKALSNDSRFIDSSSVKGTTPTQQRGRINFFAGAPITGQDKQPVGVVSVTCSRSKNMDDFLKKRLVALAAELEASLREMRENDIEVKRQKMSESFAKLERCLSQAHSVPTGNNALGLSQTLQGTKDTSLGAFDSPYPSSSLLPETEEHETTPSQKPFADLPFAFSGPSLDLMMETRDWKDTYPSSHPNSLDSVVEIIAHALCVDAVYLARPHDDIFGHKDDKSWTMLTSYGLGKLEDASLLLDPCSHRAAMEESRAFQNVRVERNLYRKTNTRVLPWWCGREVDGRPFVSGCMVPCCWGMAGTASSWNSSILGWVLVVLSSDPKRIMEGHELEYCVQVGGLIDYLCSHDTTTGQGGYLLEEMAKEKHKESVGAMNRYNAARAFAVEGVSTRPRSWTPTPLSRFLGWGPSRPTSTLFVPTSSPTVSSPPDTFYFDDGESVGASSSQRRKTQRHRRGKSPGSLSDSTRTSLLRNRQSPPFLSNFFLVQRRGQVDKKKESEKEDEMGDEEFASDKAMALEGRLASMPITPRHASPSRARRSPLTPCSDTKTEASPFSQSSAKFRQGSKLALQRSTELLRDSFEALKLTSHNNTCSLPLEEKQADVDSALSATRRRRRNSTASFDQIVKALRIGRTS